MKKNRFISIVVTLTMLLSSLSGLTAITANAEGEPALSDFVLMQKYSANFSEWTRDSSSKKLETYDDTNWTTTGTVKLNDTNYPELNPGTLCYKNTFEGDAVYYRYQIRMTNFGDTTQTVSLTGAGGDIVVLTSPLTANDKYYVFTTAVKDNIAYTYDQDGTLKGTVTLTDTPTGIKFANTKGNLLIQSFNCGKVVDVPELSSYNFLGKHSADFSTWTQNTDGTALENYDSTNWKQSGKVGINGSKLVQAKAASGDLTAGSLTFTNTSTTDKFYYEYEVRLATAACELTLKLDNEEKAVVLSTPYNSDKGTVYKYTTVVDGKIAYTYGKDNKPINAVEFTGNALGIKFASAGGEVLIKSFTYGELINPPALSDYVQVQEHKPDFSDWTATDDNNGATLTKYDNENWEQGGRLGVTMDGVMTVQIKAAKDTLADGQLTYNKAAGSGMFYYNYEIRMTDSSSSRNSISLAGVENAVVLTSPISSDGKAYLKYTTVVDVDDNMAYTYDADGKFLKAVEFTGTVTGITFKSTGGQEIRIKEISFGKLKKDANISIDYKNEKLTGFVESGTYTIDSKDVTPENNELTIADTYFGKTLAIGGTLNGEELTQSLVVAARPAAPVADTDYTLTQPTVYGAKGSIKATAADTLEYKVDNGEWTSLPTDAVEVAQGSTVQIRKSATDSAFASEPAEETIDTIAQKFTVTWKNDSETLETDENVVDGTQPSYNGTTPTKEADAQYTYTFDGWTTEGDDGTVYNTTAGEGVSAFETVTGNVTYTAHFSKALRSYTISWKNADGTDYITAQTLDYGSAVTAPEGTPVKDSTADNIYTFDKWTPEITADTKVTGDQTYTATFTESAREYNITYNLNGHGTALTGNNLKYTAGTAKELPALTDDNYNFGGWYEDNTTFNTAAQITAATRGDKTFYAKWTAKTYAVSAAAELTNGSVSVNKTTASLNDEITVTITPNTGYQLASLTIGGAAVTGEALTNAVSSNSYTFTMPAEAVVVSATFEKKAANRVEVTLNNSTATHGTAATITASAKVYAADNTDITSLYASEIEWTLDETTTTANKTTISGNGESVTVFVGAEQAVGTVTVTAAVGDKSDNKAITVSSEATYAITVDNTITGGTVTTNPSGSTTKGQTVTITATPNNGYQLKADSVKVNGGEITVTNNTFTMPEGNVTVTAEFEQINYTITWNDDDGNLIDTTTVAHGETPTHAIPTKASTAEFDYTFAGWSPEIVTATENATYTATFTPVTRKYTATFNLNGGNINGNTTNVGVQTDYNTAPVPPENPTREGYTFAGWSPAVGAITEDTTFTARWEENAPDTVTVTFNAGEGTFADSAKTKTVTINKGASLEATDLPAVTPPTGYTFDGWGDITGKAINEPVTYTAAYTIKTFTITWMLDESTKLDDTIVNYNAVPTHANPTKADTDEFTYTFAGWTPEITAATDNAIYTAQFDSVKRKYTITWYDEDGSTVLDTDEAEYGTVPQYKGNAPAKAEDDEYTYTFAGWTTDPIAVTGAASYTAKYTPVAKEAPKTYLDLLSDFSSWLRIEKANAASGDIVLTATREESSQETIPALAAYIAVYSEGALQSVHKYDFVSNAVTLSAAAATGDYKIFIWTGGENGMQPVIDTITAETTGNNKLF